MDRTRCVIGGLALAVTLWLSGCGGGGGDDGADGQAPSENSNVTGLNITINQVSISSPPGGGIFRA